MTKKTFVYDLETLDIFTATFLDKDSDYFRQFVISDDKDERYEMFKFLKEEVQALIGYNCLTFDAQILEFIYRHPDTCASEIRRYAEIITSGDNRRPDVYEWNLRIPHLDLFRALSLNVKSKRTSLKWCEYMLDMENIEDMPSQGDGDNWEEKVLSYNYNDTISTKELYIKNYHEIDLRKKMTKTEGINLLNSSEPDIARKLFSKYLSSAMGIRKNDLEAMSTSRDSVQIKDILFPYIDFKSSQLNSVFESYKSFISTSWNNFEFPVLFGGIELFYGLGGLHGSLNNKIVESTEKLIIKSCDVRSMYPNLAIRNKLHPAHLPQETFCNLYESLYEQRIALPKSDPKNYILKIVLNALYGLTNDEYSFLRDRQMTLSICINGQLSISMLIEDIILNIPEAKLLMANTDGFEILLPKEYEPLYYEFCKKWELLTKLELEYDEYEKLIIVDVNNYIGKYTNGKTKCKGKFEFENIPLHKNKSHNIISIAVFNYFIKGISVEDTIHNHRNIFDFCAGVRAKSSETSVRGKAHYELHYMQDKVIMNEKLSKTVRYYISKKGGTLIKVYENGTVEQVEAPERYKSWRVTVFNRAFYPESFDSYGIDMAYYINRANNWIRDVENKQQLTLF
jgi:hypothetical protein